MKPTEQNNELEKELIAHIKESLADYEEPYNVGAWENFNKKKGRRSIIFWLPLTRGVAATLLLGTITFFIARENYLIDDIKNSNVSRSISSNIGTTKDNETVSIKTDKTAENAIHQATKDRQLFVKKRTKTISHNLENTAALTVDSNLKAENFTPITIQKSNEILAFNATDIDSNHVLAQRSTKQIDIMAFFENETKLNASLKKDSDKKPDRKIMLGLLLAPSISDNEKIDMGYGVSVDLKLSNSLSLNSGIVYSKMSAAKQTNLHRNALIENAMVSANTKTLKQTSEIVSGIDIPLALKYNLSKSIYTNFGFSVYAILQQKRQNTYLEEKFVQKTTEDYEFAGILVAEQTTELEILRNQKDNTYLSFYNISLGYKKPFGKSNTIAVEPFMKLPIKDAKVNNLRLVGTGVKLKFDF